MVTLTKDTKGNGIIRKLIHRIIPFLHIFLLLRPPTYGNILTAQLEKHKELSLLDIFRLVGSYKDNS